MSSSRENKSSTSEKWQRRKVLAKAAGKTALHAISFIFAAVLAHELGHLFVGIWLGAQPEVLSIGFGSSPAWKIGEVNGVSVQMTPWLMGGYVSFKEIEPEIISFTGTVWKDIIILLSGVAVNFLIWLGFAATAKHKLTPTNFGRVNLDLCLFNSIPLSALDGGKAAFLVLTLLGLPKTSFLWFFCITTGAFLTLGLVFLILAKVRTVRERKKIKALELDILKHLMEMQQQRFNERNAEQKDFCLTGQDTHPPCNTSLQPHHQ